MKNNYTREIHKHFASIRHPIGKFFLCILLITMFNGTAAEPEDSGQNTVEKLDLAIPYKPDPPVSMDGILNEWAKVPVYQLNREEQVIYGKDKWGSTNDLSAKVWLAWREECLYIAADVRDDVHCQTDRGRDLYKGDHVELYLDVTPDVDSGRDPFGDGQWIIAFNPGNFQHTGDLLQDIKAEAWIYHPTGRSATKIMVVAQRTETGYAIEASVPWPLLGVKPEIGTGLTLEVAVSDCDEAVGTQQTMMTISPEKWAGGFRKRMIPAVLAGSDAKPVPRKNTMPGIPIFKHEEIPIRQEKEITFSVGKIPSDREAVLGINARLEMEYPGGYAVAAMKIGINGTWVTADSLRNRAITETMRRGQSLNMATGETFTVGYSNTFRALDASPEYGLKNGKASLVEVDVTKLLKPNAENTLTIANSGNANTLPLVVGHGKLTFQTAPPPPRVKAGAPTGELPVFTPAASHGVDYTLENTKDGKLTIGVHGDTWQVTSQFSTPAPAWTNQSNTYFTFKRTTEKLPEAILVKDTFTNLTKEILPVMLRYHAGQTGGKLPEVAQIYLAGLPVSSDISIASQASPAHPSAFGASKASGLALLALDDVFRVHIGSFADMTEKTFGLTDKQLVIRPGESHTVEWAIFPVGGADPYYAFVNAARRLNDVNFMIDGSFSFMRGDPGAEGQWSDEKLADYIKYKSLKYGCLYNCYPAGRTPGVPPLGLEWQGLDISEQVKLVNRLRQIAPTLKSLYYYHSFSDTSEEAMALFSDARLLTSAGEHADYGNAELKLYIPTETNSFGVMTAKSLDIILDKIGADGVFWDEFEYSRYEYHYGEPWDGCSADINAKTMTVDSLKSSVTLLSLPWRMAQAKRILAHGERPILTGNGAPRTRTTANLHFPRFVETGSSENCADIQLYTPIGLGDHLTEREGVDAYRSMLRNLDYGCVYYWYTSNATMAFPTHKFLTEYMFPITPVELHAGYIIGKERIITKKSGLFGWSDLSEHEVHVFNAEGKEAVGFTAPMLTKNGANFTELRLPEDWSAAILRKLPK
jgi:hypothetical protein